MPPRPDVSEKRRNQILESAMKVFAREGFAYARMEDVAVASGLSKGLLYWYFKNKDDLIIAIADPLFGVELRKIEKLNCDGLSASRCLMKYLDVFIQDLIPTLNFRPMVYEFYALAFRNKLVRRMIQQYLQKFIALIEEVVRRGVQAGEFQGDAHKTALAVGAMLEGTLVLWVLDPEAVDIETQLHDGIEMVLAGLKK